jgi:hypothetical protein
MRQLLLTLLAVITLLSQWGWVEHAYHEHDPGEICAVCLTGNAHDHALTPSLPQLPVVSGYIISAQTSHQMLVQRAARYYPTRAPPRFL